MRLAEAAQCQVAYVSHVLNGSNDFSLEHAERISQLLLMNEKEIEYFILLVEFGRAGSSSLKTHFRNKIERMRDDQTLLRNRVKINESLELKDQMIYYSSWIYSGIHMLITIPEFQTLEKISQRLHLPKEDVKTVLAFLEEKGFARFESGRYLPSGRFLHLEWDSPMIVGHHSQWRQRAISSISKKRSRDSVHYSGCFSLSETDVKILRKMTADFIDQAISFIKPSKEEKLYSLGLDLFEVE